MSDRGGLLFPGRRGRYPNGTYQGAANGFRLYGTLKVEGVLQTRLVVLQSADDQVTLARQWSLDGFYQFDWLLEGWRYIVIGLDRTVNEHNGDLYDRCLPEAFDYTATG